MPGCTPFVFYEIIRFRSRVELGACKPEETFQTYVGHFQRTVTPSGFVHRCFGHAHVCRFVANFVTCLARAIVTSVTHEQRGTPLTSAALWRQGRISLITLMPGFHMIALIVPIAPIVRQNVGRSGRSLWSEVSPYDRKDRPVVRVAAMNRKCR